MRTLILVVVMLTMFVSNAFAWNCYIHDLIARLSGHGNVNACKADAEPRLHEHWETIPEGATIVASDFDGTPNAFDGDLFEYLLDENVSIAERLHGIADITMPLHLIPKESGSYWGEFNEVNHKNYDQALVKPSCITPVEYPELTAELLAQVANKTVEIAYSGKFTNKQACAQVSISIGLAKLLK